ncbi:hypothetical protein [Bifidobacterium sp.]|uniref:hypothetical protein n=1 Tax=Bifidobacterium sp. TaxID=41200 RepID=UPI0025BCCA39|nr:hypothetical protein [Bifidobacterium sp.]MCH4161236.1 hypothetical protein [Bifidobacterium sp.]MCH4175505.1 hypothetical protein [Bifidobacterium sp.]MCI1635339.1 hypothetical protein [Bifidobacterium sp.]
MKGDHAATIMMIHDAHSLVHMAVITGSKLWRHNLRNNLVCTALVYANTTVMMGRVE